jgi:hypothetical protein
MERLKEAEREKASEESAGRCAEQQPEDPKGRRCQPPPLADLCCRQPSPLAVSNTSLVGHRLLPRPSFGILFDYAYDYDKKGIIYWIATNRGRGTIHQII